MDEEAGAGFISNSVRKVRKFFSPCLCYGKGTSKIIKQYGFYPIVGMQIYRTPLNNVLGVALNVLTLGQWFSLMKEFGFDKFYHLALVVTVQTPKGHKNIIIEKNETINVSTSYSTNKNTETLPVGIRPDRFSKGISHLLIRTRQVAGDDAYFLYDAFRNNCQYFIKYILQSNDLYSEEAAKFLFQDISELASKLPSFVKSTARGITDTAATFKKIIGAGGSEGEKLTEVRSIAKSKGIKGEINFSPNKNKKYVIQNSYGKINFGQKGYDDFLDHKDPKRKANFHNRFQNNVGYNDPKSGLYYSQKLLW